MARGLSLVAGALFLVGGLISADAGNGVTNASAATFSVLAQGNWWGAPGGPVVGLGDGVSLGVDATLPLAAPSTLGY